MSALPAPSYGPLHLSLRSTGERVLLVAAEKTALAGVSVERLELEVPGADGAEGPVRRYQHRRCRVTAAALAVDDEGLEALMRARSAAARAAGFDELRARALEGFVQLAARLRPHDDAAGGELTARAYLAPSGRALRVALADVRLFGVSARPLPLAAHDLLIALVGDALGALQGPADVEIRPLDALLWAALPPAGWRLPDTSTAGLAEVAVRRGRVELGYAQGAEAPAAAAPFAGLVALARPDGRLLAGDVNGAVAGYRDLLAAGGPHAAAALERLLAVLAGRPGAAREAEQLARDAVARAAGFVPGHAALGALALAAGRRAEAADCFARVAELAEAAGDDEEAVRAAAAAARLLRDEEPRRAARLYEQVLARRPADAEAAEALSDLYAGDERWSDLVRLARRRLAGAAPAEQAREHVRLAEIYLTRVGDAERAREEVARGLALDESDPRAWDVAARSAAAAGDASAALRALERLAALHAAKGDAVGEARAHAHMAALAEVRADDERASAAYERALSLTPDDPELLARLAASLARQGRQDEAVLTYGRLAEHAVAGAAEPRQRAALRDLARLQLGQGDLEGARRSLEQAADPGAADAGEESDRLVIAADVEERAGDARTAAAVLARAAQLTAGEEAARLELRRARLAAVLDDGAEQRAALERAVALWPEGARREAAGPLAAAAREQGDAAAEAAWLDELLAGEPGAADRPALALRRAELAFGDGDLARARALLAEASEQPGAQLLAAEVLQALGDLDGALVAARAADPEPRARRLLGEIAWRTRSWEDVATAYQPLLVEAPAEERAEIGRRLGIAYERLSCDDDARASYRKVVDSAFARGEPLAVSWRRLAALAEKTGEPVRAAELLSAGADDPRTEESAAARAEQHHIAAGLLSAAGLPDQGVLELEAALRAVPDYMPSLDVLESIHQQAGDGERLAAILGRKIAATARQPDRQKALLGRLAELQQALGRADAAREAYRRALEIDPGFRPSLRWLAEDARARGAAGEAEPLEARLAAPEAGEPEIDDQWSQTVASLLARARDAGRETRLELLREAVGLLDGPLGRPDDATPVYAEIAVLDPDDEVARRRAGVARADEQDFAALSAELRRAEDWTTLLATLDRRAASAPPGQRALLLDEAAEIAARLGDLDGALARLDAMPGGDATGRRAELLARLGRLAEARAALAGAAPGALTELALGRLRWAEGSPADALRHLLAAADSGALDYGLAAEASALAAQAHQALGQIDQAMSLYERASLLAPTDPRPVDALYALAELRGDTDLLAELLGRKVLLRDDPTERAQLWLERARLYLGSPHREAEAYRCLKEAHANDPSLLEAMRLLREHAARLGEWPLVAELLYREIDATSDEEARAVLHGELAAVYEERMGDSDAAGRNRESAAALLEVEAPDLSEPEPVSEVREILVDEGDDEEISEDVGAAIALEKSALDLIAPGDVHNIIEARMRLGDLCRRAGDIASAIDYFELVLAEQPARVGALRALAELYGAADRWPEAVEALEKLSRLATSGEERAELLYQMGEVYRLRIGDEELASDAYLKAVDLEPGHLPTLRRLLDYYWGAANDAALAEIAQDLDGKGELRHADTAPETLARVAVSLALAGDLPAALSLVGELGPKAVGAMASALAEASARRPEEIDDVAAAARKLCTPPGPSLDDVKAVLVMRAPRDSFADLLAARL